MVELEEHEEGTLLRHDASADIPREARTIGQPLDPGQSKEAGGKILQQIRVARWGE